MDDYFYARLDDLAARASKGELAAGDFLSPAESFSAKRYYERLGTAYALYGGYAAAERKLVAALPDWAAFSTERESCAGLILPVRIVASGYVALGHRDYMGALLGLGIDRSKVGDICPDECGATVFARESIASFLLSTEKPLTKVASDTVRIESAVVAEDFDGGRKFESVSGVAASARIDSVLSALTNLTREKAKESIRAGNIQINYEDAAESDREVRCGDVISARGIGKFVINDLSSRTRKDKIRVAAEKYV